MKLFIRIYSTFKTRLSKIGWGILSLGDNKGTFGMYKPKFVFSSNKDNFLKSWAVLVTPSPIAVN
jgi:hypothetical protein